MNVPRQSSLLVNRPPNQVRYVADRYCMTSKVCSLSNCEQFSLMRFDKCLELALGVEDSRLLFFADPAGEARLDWSWSLFWTELRNTDCSRLSGLPS